MKAVSNDRSMFTISPDTRTGKTICNYGMDQNQSGLKEICTLITE